MIDPLSLTLGIVGGVVGKNMMDGKSSRKRTSRKPTSKKRTSAKRKSATKTRKRSTRRC